MIKDCKSKMSLPERNLQMWWAKFGALKQMVERDGIDPNASKSHPTHGSWLDTQRMAKKRGVLAPERMKALEVLGVVWEPHEKQWDTMFEGLKALAAARGGDPNVPHSHPTHGTWLNTQRMAKKRGTLAPERAQALEELGVWWGKSYEEQWITMFEGLKALAAARGGDPNVPHSHPTHGTWLDTQRMAKKRGTLAPERVKALEELGVKWVLRAPRKKPGAA